MRLIVFTWHSFVVLCVLFLTGFNIFANGSGLNAPSFQQYLTDKTGVMFQPCAIVPGLRGYEVRQSGNDDAKKKHYDSRDGHKVDFLVLHYTDCNVIITLRAFTSGQGDNRKSSHYVITQDECVGGGSKVQMRIPGGIAIRVVPEEQSAWHTGESQFLNAAVKSDDGPELYLNKRSIGIELVHCPRGCDRQVRFDPKQIKTLAAVLWHLVKKHGIKPSCLVGHEDIACGRKNDPGLWFPWGELHKHYGLGAWLTEKERHVSYIQRTWRPTAPFPRNVDTSSGLNDVVNSPEACFFMKCQLKQWGYDIQTDTFGAGSAQDGCLSAQDKEVLKAFKRHFSFNCNPQQCKEDQIQKIDLIWIYGLNAKYRRQEKGGAGFLGFLWGCWRHWWCGRKPITWSSPSRGVCR